MIRAEVFRIPFVYVYIVCFYATWLLRRFYIKYVKLRQKYVVQGEVDANQWQDVFLGTGSRPGGRGGPSRSVSQLSSMKRLVSRGRQPSDKVTPHTPRPTIRALIFCAERHRLRCPPSPPAGPPPCIGWKHFGPGHMLDTPFSRPALLDKVIIGSLPKAPGEPWCGKMRGSQSNSAGSFIWECFGNRSEL